MEKITVVKIGGNVIDDPAALRGFLADFASLPGAKILVHGYCSHNSPIHP